MSCERDRERFARASRSRSGSLCEIATRLLKAYPKVLSAGVSFRNPLGDHEVAGEALQDFQLAIAPLLKLGKISEWNGTILKQREEKIRESAWILGGKCLAILLENLASSQEACSRALTRSSRMVAPKNE